MSATVSLSCGAAVVQRLLPQRPPFLMVDRLDTFTPGKRPSAQASQFLSASAPFFAGHFPDAPIMPGALMLEGAGQTASLVFTLTAILDGYIARGATLERLVGDLAALDAAYALRRGMPDADALLVTEAFERVRGLPVGVAGGVRMKFLEPVVPGCRLIYEATLTHRLADQVRFEVRAEVDGRTVLEGSLAAAIVEHLAIPRR